MALSRVSVEAGVRISGAGNGAPLALEPGRWAGAFKPPPAKTIAPPASSRRAPAKPTRRDHETRGATWRRWALAWRVRRGRWAPARLFLGPPRARAERWDGPGIDAIVAARTLWH